MLNRTDARILNELFPGRTFATASLVEIAPNNKSFGIKRSNSRLRLKPVPKKERIINDVNLRLSDLIKTLEDQGASLRIRPVPEKFLIYEILCPVTSDDGFNDDLCMDQDEQNHALNTLKRHEL